MQKAIQIHIPQPCHEDWQQMTPVDKGRFCQSCAKQVVDFSMMSDQQILNYISNAAGKLCGRFAEDQLQRPLLPVKQEKKKMWWIAAMMPLVMVFGKVGAQKKKVRTEKTSISIKEYAPQTMGIVSIPIGKIKPVGDTTINTATEITGMVLNTSGLALPFASIRVVGRTISTIADSTGHFKLKFHSYEDSIEIEASAIGYESVKILVTEEKKDIVFSLNEIENKLPEVVVTGYDTQKKLTGFAGAYYITKRVTYIDKVDTLIRGVFHTQAFNIYPNPAQRGQSITIDTKKEGTYSIQLFNNNGKLLQVKEFNAIEGATQTMLNIPSSFAAGMYYIRLVDNKTKKQYTDKLIVQ